MHYLYHGGGASITDIGGPLVGEEEWDKTRCAAIRLLVARRQVAAAALLERMPFEWVDATNFFHDEFSVLQLVVPVERYVALQEKQLDKTIEHPFKAIAETISEIAPQRPTVRFVTAQLDTDAGNTSGVPAPTPRITSESVDAALADAELLARARGPAQAIDRAHTALHGYLRAALARLSVDVSTQAPATELFKRLREVAPSLKAMVEGSEESKRIVMSLATIVDATNTLRNTASAAHPTDRILARAEAMLVIHVIRSLIHYLDDKLSGEE